MDKIKVALIDSRAAVQWDSCSKISKNLLKSYQRESEEFEIRRVTFANDAPLVAKQIELFNPDQIVFCDPSPETLLILQYFPMKQAAKNPTILIHVYGDFTWNLTTWLSYEPFLRGRSVRFLCASERYVRFFKRFLVLPDAALLCPFSVEHRAFSFSSRLRQSFRKSRGIADDETVWLYSGRISLQKNIDRILIEFASALESNPKQRLVIVGKYDDRAFAFAHFQAPLGYQYQHIVKTIRTLPVSVQDKIVMCHDATPTDLRSYYCGADIFLSLSLHHDEDFGMAPAEALSSGLPSILTDWGGYPSFFKKGLLCRLVPVRFDGAEYSISSVELQADVLKMAQEPRDREARMRRGTKLGESFGIDAVGARLGTILNQSAPPTFKGFSGAAAQYIETFQKGDAPSFRCSIYKDFYEALFTE